MGMVKYNSGKSKGQEVLVPVARSLAPHDPSFSGSRIRCKVPAARPSRRARSASVLAVAIVLCSASAMVFLTAASSEERGLTASINGTSVIQLTLVYQHKDTHNICTAGPPCPGEAPDVPHAWDHASGTDGVFGTSDDCPHCSAYSVPAAISMVATAYGRTGQYVQQDRIYDNGKSVSPEVTGDNEMQTHGVGLFDGSGGQPDEAQDAVRWSIGTTLGLGKHGSSDPLTAAELEQYIYTMRPVLWIDHGGWPVNQSSSFPPSANKAVEGHGKVIAGYDDNNTEMTDDDRILVYDPWPEYDRRGILPVNATPGPGGTHDPYWIPLDDVDLTDTSDIFFVSSTSIPEFGSVVVPIVGMLVVAAVVRRTRSRKETA